MDSGIKPLTIDNDWDRFYREFPDVYDRFALSSVNAINLVHEMFNLTDKSVVDVGSGTGQSTFEISKRARLVVGIEPWEEMRRFAFVKKQTLGIRNVEFVNAAAEALPLSEHSVDLVISVWGFPFWFAFAGEKGTKLARAFTRDSLRALKPGGSVIAVVGAPGQYAGSLTSNLFHENSDITYEHSAVTSMYEGLDFVFNDFDVNVDYGTVQEAVETYGFIYGDAAIRYLSANNISRLKWKLRIYHKSVQ